MTKKYVKSDFESSEVEYSKTDIVKLKAKCRYLVRTGQTIPKNIINVLDSVVKPKKDPRKKKIYLQCKESIKIAPVNVLQFINFKLPFICEFEKGKYFLKFLNNNGRHKIYGITSSTEPFQVVLLEPLSKFVVIKKLGKAGDIFFLIDYVNGCLLKTFLSGGVDLNYDTKSKEFCIKKIGSAYEVSELYYKVNHNTPFEKNFHNTKEANLIPATDILYGNTGIITQKGFEAVPTLQIQKNFEAPQLNNGAIALLANIRSQTIISELTEQDQKKDSLPKEPAKPKEPIPVDLNNYKAGGNITYATKITSGRYDGKIELGTLYINDVLKIRDGRNIKLQTVLDDKILIAEQSVTLDKKSYSIFTPDGQPIIHKSIMNGFNRSVPISDINISDTKILITFENGVQKFLDQKMLLDINTKFICENTY